MNVLNIGSQGSLAGAPWLVLAPDTSDTDAPRPVTPRMDLEPKIRALLIRRIDALVEHERLQGIASAPLPSNVTFLKFHLSQEYGHDQFAYAAVLPLNADPHQQGDPNKASFFYVERSGGLLGRPIRFGPFPVDDPPDPGASSALRVAA